MSTISAAAIAAAAARIQGSAVRTPLLDVSRQADRPLRLKCENLQVTGSFKYRGATSMITSLGSGADRQRRNHLLLRQPRAGGRPCGPCARHSGRRGDAAHGAAVKVEGARAHGAEVLFEGTTSTERRVRAEHEARGAA